MQVLYFGLLVLGDIKKANDISSTLNIMIILLIIAITIYQYYSCKRTLF